jgi:hypothetical protein
MILNATIIVQACNFGLVWLAFYILVLKPALVLLTQKVQRQQAIKDTCAHMRLRMNELQESRYKVFHNLHMRYVHTILQYAPSDRLDMVDEVVPVPLHTEEEQSLLIDQMKKIIVRRIKDRV